MVETHDPKAILHFLVDVKLQKGCGLCWLSSLFPFGWFCPHLGKFPFPPCEAVRKRLRDNPSCASAISQGIFKSARFKILHLHVSVVVVKSTSLWHWNMSRVFSLHGNKKLSGIINASQVHFSFQKYFEIFILILFLFDHKSNSCQNIKLVCL